MLDTGNPQLLGFEIKGKPGTAEVEQVVEPLQRAYEGEQKIDLGAALLK